MQNSSCGDGSRLLRVAASSNSAIKRALKDALSPGLSEAQRAALFGRDGDGAGLLGPQEAQLLLLPVPAAAGAVAWVTSPMVLQRFARQARVCGKLFSAPAPGVFVEYFRKHEDRALIPIDSPLVERIGSIDHVGLLDYDLFVRSPVDNSLQQAIEDWAGWLAEHAFAGDDSAWTKTVTSRVAVIHDAVFDELATRLPDRARNHIAKNGVADNLWREEYVPEDSVFWCLIGTLDLPGHKAPYPDAASALAVLDQGNPNNGGIALQIGGNASLGQGLCELHLVQSPSESEEGAHG